MITSVRFGVNSFNAVDTVIRSEIILWLSLLVTGSDFVCFHISLNGH